jgi:potassium-transporting ATPase KdpC subunit
MFGKSGKELWVGLRITLLIAIITGIAYPLVMTGISQVAFHDQANGSLITDSKGNVVGSKLIGQCFYAVDAKGNLTTLTDKATGAQYYAIDPRYFQSRPLWTVSGGAISLPNPPCNAGASGGSNLGPNSQILVNQVKGYTNYLHGMGVAVNPDGSYAPMPVDLVTGDFTGFDPDISEAAAMAQVNMVARARHLDAARVTQLVASHEQGRALGIFGSPHVNVLELNMALDGGGAN